MQTKKTNIALLLTIIIFLFAGLVCLIIFPRKYQTSSLMQIIENVLEQKEADRFLVGKRTYFNSPLCEYTYFFKIVDINSPQTYFEKDTAGTYAILTRVTGLNGPVSVVFYGTEYNLEFAGIAGIDNSQSDIVQFGLTENMLNYWKKNLSRVLSRGENEL